MEYVKFGNTAVARLDAGDEIFSCIKHIAEEEKITLAEVSGIGAVSEAVVSTFLPEKKEYRKNTFSGNFEVVSLDGNITVKDGEPYLHVHIGLADEDGKMYGGHLISGKISVTGEIFIRIAEGSAGRKTDAKNNINIIEF